MYDCGGDKGGVSDAQIQWAARELQQNYALDEDNVINLRQLFMVLNPQTIIALGAKEVDKLRASGNHPIPQEFIDNMRRVIRIAFPQGEELPEQDLPARYHHHVNLIENPTGRRIWSTPHKYKKYITCLRPMEITERVAQMRDGVVDRESFINPSAEAIVNAED